MALGTRPDLAKPYNCNAKWKGALDLARGLSINSVHAATPQGLYNVLSQKGWTFDQALQVWARKAESQDATD